MTSPTFTIVNRYDDGRVPVSHLDLYRLGDAGLAGEDPALLEDELAGDRIVFIEWPDAAADLISTHAEIALRVALRHEGDPPPAPGGAPWLTWCWRWTPPPAPPPWR